MYKLTSDDFKYKINGDNLIFVKLLNNKIDGKDYIVNEIVNDAFKNNKIKNIELPDTIEKNW